MQPKGIPEVKMTLVENRSSLQAKFSAINMEEQHSLNSKNRDSNVDKSAQNSFISPCLWIKCPKSTASFLKNSITEDKEVNFEGEIIDETTGVVSKGKFIDKKLFGRGTRTTKFVTIDAEWENDHIKELKNVQFLENKEDIPNIKIKKGNENGAFSIIDCGGNFESGNFRNGHLEGLQNLNRYSADGTSEIGGFKLGLLEGKGVKTFPSGTVSEGLFKLGVFQFGHKDSLSIFYKKDVFMKYLNKGNLDGIRNIKLKVSEGILKVKSIMKNEKNIRIIEGSFTYFDGKEEEGKFIDEYLIKGKKVLPIEPIKIEYDFEGNQKLPDRSKILNFTIEEGEFEEQKLTKGKRTWASGGFEEGVFINGKLEDEKGRRKWKIGVLDEGVFLNGKLNGLANRINSEVTIKGIWENDELNQINEIVDKFGRIVEAEFRREKPFLDKNQKQEILTENKNTAIVKKEINSNEFFKFGTKNANAEIEIFEGTLINEYGMIQEGRFINGRLEGKGRKILVSGKIQEGVFENGDFVRQL